MFYRPCPPENSAQSPVKLTTIISLLVLSAVAICPGVAAADASPKTIANGDSAYVLRVDTVTTKRGMFASVNVILDEVAGDMGSFDITLSYNREIATLMGVNAVADLMGQCDWEYFTYGTGPTVNCGGTCPGGMVRLMGFAEIDNGPIHPTCYMPDSLPARLAKLNFLLSNREELSCEFMPIRFFWATCEHNIVLSGAEDECYIAGKVFDHDGSPIDPSDTFPNFTGPLDYCEDSTHTQPAYSNINIINGGIQIACDTSVLIGDINGDGLAYWPSDAVMFANYFVEGLPAFPDGLVQDAIDASDTNGDGLPLTLTDYVHHIRMVWENAIGLPEMEPSPNIARFIYGNERRVLAVETADSLGALWLTFEGEVTPTLLQDGVGMLYNHLGGNTKVLIGDVNGGFVSTGDIISVEGAGALIDMQAVTFYGQPVNTTLDTSSEYLWPFALSQNCPNPFNPKTDISFRLPYQSRVRLEIYNSIGQRIATAVDAVFPEGWNTVQWDGTGVASGIYYYRLVTGNFVDSRKMLLIK